MPLVLIIIGIVLIIAAARDKASDLFTLVGGEFTGPNNFLQWILAFLLIGALGYIPKLRPLSVAFLTLVIVAIFVRKGSGFFSNLSTAVNGATSPSSTKI